MGKKYFEQDFWRTKWYLHSTWQTTGWEEAMLKFYWSCRKISARDSLLHITKTLSLFVLNPFTEPCLIKHSKPSATLFAPLYSILVLLKRYVFPTPGKSNIVYNTTSVLVWWKSFHWAMPWMLFSCFWLCVYGLHVFDDISKVLYSKKYTIFL